MLASRIVPRAVVRSSRTARPVQASRLFRQQLRHESTTSSSTPPPPSSSGTSSAVLGGVVGGLIVFLGGYGYYHYSGAGTLVSSAQKTKAYFDGVFKKTAESTPEPSQALQWLRQQATSYAGMIPGAKGYVDTAFDDLDKIHAKHSDEVDAIVKNAYNELKEVSKNGASIETVTKAWDVIQKYMKEIGGLAGDAAEDIMENHPQLKEQFGGQLKSLKQMGEQYGPEAKEAVDDTYNKVKEILAGGIGLGTVDQVRRLIQEKSAELKKFGDQAWQKGMEQAKPFLDKQPELKKLVEENKDKLLKGDLGQLWNMVQEAAKSGNTDDLQKFVKDQVSSASSQTSGGFGQLFSMVPGGSEIMPKLQKLQELSQQQGKEAEQLIKDTINDIKNVLQKRVSEGEKLAEKAKNEVKK